jgi:HSP20 family molecular chaperone IbpA
MLPSSFGENLFDTFFGTQPLATAHDAYAGKQAHGLMKTDVRELENTYELDIELPGYKKGDVKLELDDGYLTISAARTSESSEKDGRGQYIRRERSTGACSRTFFVGEALEPKDVAARFEDGILKLSFPKDPKPRIPEKKLINID